MHAIILTDNAGLSFVGDINDIDLNIEHVSNKLYCIDGMCIIRWGTSKHIAELKDGPTSKTVLGKKEKHYLLGSHILLIIPTDGEKWK